MKEKQINVFIEDSDLLKRWENFAIIYNSFAETTNLNVRSFKNNGFDPHEDFPLTKGENFIIEILDELFNDMDSFDFMTKYFNLDPEIEYKNLINTHIHIIDKNKKTVEIKEIFHNCNDGLTIRLNTLIPKTKPE